MSGFWIVDSSSGLSSFLKKYIDNLNFIYKTRGTFTYKKDEHTFPDTKTKLVVLVKK